MVTDINFVKYCDHFYLVTITGKVCYYCVQVITILLKYFDFQSLDSARVYKCVNDLYLHFLLQFTWNQLVVHSCMRLLLQYLIM